MANVAHPNPLSMVEVCVLLDEHKVVGDERESVLRAVRVLDAAWRDEWYKSSEGNEEWERI